MLAAKVDVAVLRSMTLGERLYAWRDLLPVQGGRQFVQAVV